MDPFGISSIADSATALSQSRLQSQMQVRTLKKAMEAQEQMAMSLIEAAAVTYSSGGAMQSPATSGGGIDIVA